MTMLPPSRRGLGQNIPWTREEQEALIEAYPRGGLKAARAALPHRSDSSLKGKSESLGLRMNGRVYLKQPTTEWIDAQIKRAYRDGKPDLVALTKTLNRKRGWIKWRARHLGVARGVPQTHWTPEEDRLLEECLDRGYSIETTYKQFRKLGFLRTVSGIHSRVNTLDLSWEREWTANEIAMLFDIENHVVGKWISEGLLKAEKKRGPSRCDSMDGPCNARGMMWQIKPEAVRKFMVGHPHHWDHRRMKKEVLLDLLCGGPRGLNAGGFKKAGND